MNLWWRGFSFNLPFQTPMEDTMENDQSLKKLTVLSDCGEIEFGTLTVSQSIAKTATKKGKGATTKSSVISAVLGAEHALIHGGLPDRAVESVLKQVTSLAPKIRQWVKEKDKISREDPDLLNTEDVVGYLRCKGRIGGMTMSISGFGYRLADIDSTPFFDEMFKRDSTTVSSVVFGQEGNFLLFVSPRDQSYIEVIDLLPIGNNCHKPGRQITVYTREALKAWLLSETREGEGEGCLHSGAFTYNIFTDDRDGPKVLNQNSILDPLGPSAPDEPTPGLSHGTKRKFGEADAVFEYAGEGCFVPEDVVRVKFHPSVVRVPCEAFYKHTQMCEVIFNEGLEKIGMGAFGQCTSLESVALPSSVTEIDERAFGDCNNLRKITLNNGLQKIGRKAFCHCTSLESIVLPSTVNHIDEYLFRRCSNLREVVLNEGIEIIPRGFFENCTTLPKITLPSSIQKISFRAFYGCTSLQSILLNDGLQNIGTRAFDSCTSLDSISVPSTVTEIGCSAFDKCLELKEVNLVEGLLKVDYKAFAECSSLSRIAFPASVTSIGSWVIKDCGDLREVVLHGIITQEIASNAFFGFKSTDVIVRFPTISSHFGAIFCHWNELNNGELNNKFDEIRGLVERRDGELCVPSAAMEWRDGVWEHGPNPNPSWNNIRTIFNKIDTLISHYEMKEAQTIVELAFWKSQLDQAGCTATNRNEYCVGVPGPVKDSIMDYCQWNSSQLSTLV